MVDGREGGFCRFGGGGGVQKGSYGWDDGGGGGRGGFTLVGATDSTWGREDLGRLRGWSDDMGCIPIVLLY